MSFELFRDVLTAALSGRRLEASHGAAPRWVVFSVTDGGEPRALTITLTKSSVKVEEGRTAPADAEVALVRGSLQAMVRYMLAGDREAFASLGLYGRTESLVELGEVLRAQKNMLQLRADEAASRAPKRKRGRR
jgi:hypothetical protein